MKKIARSLHTRDLARFEIRLTHEQLAQLKKNAIDERTTAPQWAEKRIIKFLTNDENTNTQAAKPIGANRGADSAQIGN